MPSPGANRTTTGDNPTLGCGLTDAEGQFVAGATSSVTTQFYRASTVMNQAAFAGAQRGHRITFTVDLGDHQGTTLHDPFRPTTITAIYDPPAARPLEPADPTHVHQIVAALTGTPTSVTLAPCYDNVQVPHTPGTQD